MNMYVISTVCVRLMVIETIIVIGLVAHHILVNHPFFNKPRPGGEEEVDW